MTTINLSLPLTDVPRVFSFPDGVDRFVSLPDWCWVEYQWLQTEYDLDAVQAGYDSAVEIWGGHANADFEQILQDRIRNAIITISAMAKRGFEANDVGE